MIDAPLTSPEFVVLLNQYYSKALMYEFSLNNRDGLFINKIIEVIRKLSFIFSKNLTYLFLFYF